MDNESQDARLARLDRENPEIMPFTLGELLVWIKPEEAKAQLADICAHWWKELKDPQEARKIMEWDSFAVDILRGGWTMFEMRWHTLRPHTLDLLRELIVLVRGWNEGTLTHEARTVFRYWAEVEGLNVDEELKDGQ